MAATSSSWTTAADGACTERSAAVGRTGRDGRVAAAASTTGGWPRGWRPAATRRVAGKSGSTRDEHRRGQRRRIHDGHGLLLPSREQIDDGRWQMAFDREKKLGKLLLL